MGESLAELNSLLTSESSRTTKQWDRAAADFKSFEPVFGEVLNSRGSGLKLAIRRCEEKLREIGGPALSKYFEALRMETGKPPEGKESDPTYQEQAQKAVEKLMNAQLKERTGYDVTGWLGAIKAVWTTAPANIANDTKELERILNELEKLMQPVNKTTWDEVTDGWMIMYSVYQKLECARARILLEQVFADPVIRKNVGAAKQLHDIAELDKPPDGIVLLLKQAKKQVKQHQDDYVKAANR